MRRGKVWLIVVGVVIVCGLIAISLSKWVSFPSKKPYSAQNPKELGVKALYLLFEKRGKKVGLWESEYEQLPSEKQDTLIVISPSESPSPSDLQSLTKWIEKGNQLVLWASIDSKWVKAFQFNGVPCYTSAEPRRVRAVVDDPWLKEIKELDWPSQECAVSSNKDKKILLDEENHTLVVKRKVGNGSIIYIPDVSLVTNLRIDKADHLALPLAFVENRPGKIWFDETIHSWSAKPINPPSSSPNSSSQQESAEPELPEISPSFFSLLNSDGWFILLQLVIFIVFWLYAKGKRFAAPRFESVKETRDGLEYVEAMARWYHRSGIRKETLLSQHNGLREHILQTFHLPKDISEESLLQHIEQFMGNEYRQTYQNLSKIIAQVVFSKKRISHAVFVEWSVTIAQLRRELEQWKARPQISAASKV
ncbi:DUF4350 domain-containing protein [Paenactinomyces guangxiensis]|uniref:DUF4350 domain-containing protein n=1 Tax=Paenactinomyces guangxiensis TaxID=1490290 RepID=A0A7W2AAZ8_9BACL|nr:DUF4350 domain-containing protein [Paenactinomyces guangxiensis]MBA4496383.1 DUF4350 domain-containing protein [Paenactinomyces guangxiensis]MBH8593504.1 DUF4350 domain-containing protein [Paenactinomyces guangxiensis]